MKKYEIMFIVKPTISEDEIKKVASKELFDYFKEILPNYDSERVYASDVKKVYLWYNLLNSAGKIDLEEPKEETAETEAKEA